MPAVNSTFRMSGNELDEQIGDQDAELGGPQAPLLVLDARTPC